MIGYLCGAIHISSLNLNFDRLFESFALPEDQAVDIVFVNDAPAGVDWFGMDLCRLDHIFHAILGSHFACH